MVVKIAEMKLLKVLSMRYFGPVFMAFVLVACAPTVPDSAGGVGFENYSEYARERAVREEQLAGQFPTAASDEISDEIVQGTIVQGAIPVPATSDAGASQANDDATSAQPGVDTPTIQTGVDAPAVLVNVDNPTISDEQNFDAVSARETIESDAARLAAQAQAYQIIQPTALPTRRGASGPSIVEFALETTNLVGQGIYSRSTIGAQSRFNRNCAKYPSSDMAQADFLKLGGPKRDRKGLDPDGDGFACFWDPAPFRQAVQN